MELINFTSYIQLEDKAPLVVAIGQFDGFHIAHLALIEKAKEIGKKNHYKTALLTFDPHPDFILKKNVEKTYLTPLVDKAKQLASLEIDYMIIINFTMDVAKTSPSDFINNYLLAINVKEAVVGFDFTFGIYGTGKAKSIEPLSNNIIKTHIIDEIKYHNEKIGSTLIRDLLSKGKVEEVKTLMGRPYEVSAKVITGRKVGRTLKLPTANLMLSPEYAKVKEGVYGVIVKYKDKKYLGIANYGHNPSFNYKEQVTLEVNLLDFNGDLYGEILVVDFMMYLRDEVVFASKEAFIEQIKADTLKTKTTLNKYLMEK